MGRRSQRAKQSDCVRACVRACVACEEEEKEEEEEEERGGGAKGGRKGGGCRQGGRRRRGPSTALTQQEVGQFNQLVVLLLRVVGELVRLDQDAVPRL
eukprot:6205367-Pleurochrysis_carterae.AAC.1